MAINSLTNDEILAARIQLLITPTLADRIADRARQTGLTKSAYIRSVLAWCVSHDDLVLMPRNAITSSDADLLHQRQTNP